MAERTGYWNGPDSWAEPVDDADPTGGRHAFDRDAALTPIFTTLRRRVRRPYLQPVPRDRRPDPLRCDPQTAPIPVVRPLYAVDPERSYPGGVDGYVPHAPVAPPAPFPVSSAPSPTETTTWWRSPVGFPPVPARGEPPVGPGYDDPAPVPGAAGDGLGPYDEMPYDGVQYDDGSDGAGYDVGPYDAAGYDDGSYDAGYDVGSYDGAGYDEPYDGPGYSAVAYAAAPYEAVPHAAVARGAAPYGPVHEVDDGAWHDGPSLDEVRYDWPHGGVPRVRPPYDPTPYRRDAHDPNRFDPLTDTGRHHRLAPAGW